MSQNIQAIFDCEYIHASYNIYTYYIVYIKIITYFDKKLNLQIFFYKLFREKMITQGKHCDSLLKKLSASIKHKREARDDNMKKIYSSIIHLFQ